jgi:hypothetical protein
MSTPAKVDVGDDTRPKLVSAAPEIMVALGLSLPDGM